MFTNFDCPDDMLFLQVLLVVFSASSAQRGPKRFQGKLGTTVKPKRNLKKSGSSTILAESEDYGDYYDYYYDQDPLPSGPTRRLALADKRQKPSRFPG